MSNRNILDKTLNRVIELQGHICAYCTLPFGSVYKDKKGRERITTVVADHWIPWAVGGDSIGANCIAACDLCNHLKTDHVYDSLQSASRDLLIIRMERGYVTLFVPTVASTADYKEWQREYLEWFGQG